MVRFRLPEKIEKFFSRRGTSSGSEDQQCFQTVIDGYAHNVKINPNPFYLMKDSSPVKRAERDEDGQKVYVKSYKTDRPNSEGKSTFDVVLELACFEMELTMVTLFGKQEDAIRYLDSRLARMLNSFAPFLEESGKSDAFKGLVKFLRCYTENSSWTIVHFAAYFAWESFFEQQKLSAEQASDTENPSRWSPLHVAVMSGSVSIVEALVATGMDVDLRDERQSTAMHYAVFSDSSSMVGLLVSMPAFFEQLRFVDMNGYTPVYIAFANGYLSSIQTLLQQGLTGKMLSISKLQVPGDSLNVYRDYSPYVAFTQEEMANHFNMNEFQNGGCPLHWANDFALLDRLLQLKAFKTNHRNFFLDTPLITFIKRLGKEQENLDSSASKVTNTPTKATHFGGKKKKTPKGSMILRQVERKHANDRLCWLLRLLTSGGHINSQNEEGNTALHYAVANHDIASVQMLIIFGARVNLRNKKNCSALHMAAALLEELKKSSTKRSPASRGKSTNEPTLQFPAAHLNPKDAARFMQHCNQIICLLFESGARRCPATMEGCTSECLSKPVSKNTPNLDSGISLFQVCIHDASVIENDKVKNTNGKKVTKGDVNMTRSQDNDANPTRVDLDQASLEIDSSEIDSLRVKMEENMQADSRERAATNSPKEQDVVVNEKPCETKRRVNMIVLDGGNSMSGIRPLIQALIVNEIGKYLRHPLSDYFQVVAGVSYGGTLGAMLATNRSPIEAFYLFLRLKESFKSPVLSNLNANSTHLDENLLQEFGKKMELGRVGPVYKKYLMLVTTLIDREPVIQKIFQSHPMQPAFAFNATGEDRWKPLWWVCRAAGSGLYCYSNCEHHYDGGLIASNPTLDALAQYEGCQAGTVQEAPQKSASPEQDEDKDEDKKKINDIDDITKHPALDPLGLVLSVGSGTPPFKENLPVRDLKRVMGIAADVNYFTNLRNIIFDSLTIQDCFVAERGRIWCQSVRLNYARVNFAFDPDPEKTYVHKATAGTLRSMPSAAVQSGNTLLQILWSLKVQMRQKKHKFNHLAKCLEAHFRLQQEEAS